MAIETVRVDQDALRAAKLNYRALLEKIEGTPTRGDITHPAYQLGKFLEEALGYAWRDADA